jgi:tyrosine recombinase xerC
MADTSRQRILRLTRRYLCYLDTAYPGIEATRISYAQCSAFLQTLGHLKASSYNLYLFDLRGFLQFLERQHGAKIISHQLQRKTEEKKLPRGLPLDLMQQLCTPKATETAALQTNLLAIRNQAMVELLFSTGMRACELLQLRVGDFAPDLGSCAVTSAKRGVDHVAWLGEPAIVALRRYLMARGLHPKKDASAWLFPGKKAGQPLKYHALRNIIKKISEERIGCPVTPHRIRHTFATQMLIGCGCIRSVQLMLGHACLSNTARYCAVDFVHLLTAVRGFHPHGGEPEKGAKPLDREAASE